MVMLIVATIVLSAFNFSSTKAVDESSWNALMPMPTARGGLGVAVVNGKIYAIGGLSNDLPVSNNEQYDPVTNQWTAEAAMPTARSGFAVAVYNNKIYVIGGTVGNGEFVGNNEVYDPSTNTWETKGSMPTPRSDLNANIVNDKIYLISGKEYSSSYPYFAETNVNEVYDPANDSWTTKSPIQMAVYGYASTTINGTIYVVGGSKSPISQQNSALVDSNQVYNPIDDKWSLAANLPTVTTYGAATATQGYLAPSRLYFVGGYSFDAFSSKTQVYNPSNNSWASGASMSASRAYLGLAVVNDVLYAIGGFDGQNWLNINEQYKPIGYGTVPPKLQITSPENKTYSEVNLVFSIDRGVDWMGYSLDNQANVTIKAGTKLVGLSQGAHGIILYANDSQGNMGYSETIYFSVDSLPPTIAILVPQNQSYGSTDIQLTFTVNEPVAQLSYNLDGQEEISIIGNVTLPALPDGSHRLTVYATDEVGNSASKTVYFNITSFPFIEVVAIIATTTIALAAGYLVYKHRKSSSSQKQQKANLLNKKQVALYNQPDALFSKGS
jgi:N-acetylneuraminic acid mutarotase